MKVVDAPSSVAAELSAGINPRQVLATLAIDDGSGSIVAVRDPFDSEHLRVSPLYQGGGLRWHERTRCLG
jgi:hypothetical protein